MEKSFATASSVGAPKKKRRFTKVAAFFTALLVALGFTAVVSPALPAFAAAAFCCGGQFVALSSDSVTLEASNGAPFEVPVNIVVTMPAELGSGQTVYTETLLPGTDITPDIPNDELKDWTGTFGPYSVPWGATIRAYVGPTEIAVAYTNQTKRLVAPASPIQQGNTVYFTATDDYYYVDAAGTPYGATASIPTDGALLAYAKPAKADVELTGNTEWIYASVPNQQAIPPQVTKNDQDGTANDTITLGAGTGYSNPVINGLSYVPGTYNVAGLLDGKGCLTVTYTVLEGFSSKLGATYESKQCFSEATLPPADDSDVEKFVVCHATGRESDPYEKITVSGNAFRAGHGDHEGDIHGEISFRKNGETITIPAKGDQAILNNDCKVVTTDPGTEPNPNPGPGDNPAPQDPAPGQDPEPSPAPVGNPAPQDQTPNPAPQDQEPVDTDSPVTQEDDVVYVRANTSAGGEDYTPLVLSVGSAIALLLALGVSLQRKRAAAE